jgi:hypothetical protein
MMEITVRIMAIIPTLLALSFFCERYLIPGQSPSGGKKMLKRYTLISLTAVIGGSINFFPQYGQK